MADTTQKIEGAVPKKVYMHYEEGDEANHLTLKLTVPSKWAGHSVDSLKEVRGVAVVDAHLPTSDATTTFVRSIRCASSHQRC